MSRLIINAFIILLPCGIFLSACQMNTTIVPSPTPLAFPTSSLLPTFTPSQTTRIPFLKVTTPTPTSSPSPVTTAIALSPTPLSPTPTDQPTNPPPLPEGRIILLWSPDPLPPPDKRGIDETYIPHLLVFEPTTANEWENDNAPTFDEYIANISFSQSSISCLTNTKS